MKTKAKVVYHSNPDSSFLVFSPEAIHQIAEQCNNKDIFLNLNTSNPIGIVRKAEVKGNAVEIEAEIF